MKKYFKIPACDLVQKSWWGFFIFAALFVAPLAQITAGVLVAPSVIILSEKNKTGRMNLQNTTNSPKEVKISFSFGIPESDSLGNVNIFLSDSNITDAQSALGWIRAFPRKVIIPPNGSQVIRFIAKPPKGVSDGEYWARVIVESQEGTTTIPTSTDQESITTQLNMIMRTAVMLKYRTGDLVAELEVIDVTTTVTDSQVDVLVDMVNKGNVSYVGLLECKLLDADKKEISKNHLQLAVYHDLKRKISLPIVDGNFKKPYQVAVSITNKGRKDIPANEMIFGNDISDLLSLSD